MFPKRKKQTFPTLFYVCCVNKSIWEHRTTHESSEVSDFRMFFFIHEWIQERTSTFAPFIFSIIVHAIKNFLPILWKVRAIIQKRCSLYSQWIRSYSYMSKVSSFNSHLWTLKNMNGSIIIRSIKKSEKLVCNSIL